MCMSSLLAVVFIFFFFKQKTAYEMRISDCSSDVCSSDLNYSSKLIPLAISIASMPRNGQVRLSAPRLYSMNRILPLNATPHLSSKRAHGLSRSLKSLTVNPELQCPMLGQPQLMEIDRSEEHTSELQSLMRNSYAVVCLKKKKMNH